MATKQIDEPRNTARRVVSDSPVSWVMFTAFGAGMGLFETFKGKVSVQFLTVFRRDQIVLTHLLAQNPCRNYRVLILRMEQ